jgi:hypothetical protein
MLGRRILKIVANEVDLGRNHHPDGQRHSASPFRRCNVENK